RSCRTVAKTLSTTPKFTPINFAVFVEGQCLHSLKVTRDHVLGEQLELDPVWWTLSEGRIRCPEWDHTKRGDARVDSSRRSSGPVPSGWSWMRAKRSAP